MPSLFVIFNRWLTATVSMINKGSPMGEGILVQ
jgi:hypothetical protein